ncbi:MAG: polysaccharide biosynthesis/export family protein [Minicystis sp.]
MQKVSALLLVLLGLVACGPAIYETYDYTKEYDPRKHEYVIGVADQLTIAVYKMPDLSGGGTVRPDGVLTIPLIGDLLVAGKAPSQVREEIKKKLSAFIKEEPTVNVTVTGFNSYRFIVSGNVNHTGSFSQKFFVTVSEAVAMAGGANKFAGDQIVLLRTDEKGKLREIPISYKLITSGRHPEMDLAVVAGDTILVQ